VLDVSDLKCVRADRQLFEGIGFQLESGKLLYLSGANGAGKTSLLRILCGLSPAEAGTVLWDGVPIKELGEVYRRNLCYLGHYNGLQEALTVNDNLLFYAALAGTPPSMIGTIGALSSLGLHGCQHRLVRHLSQGQKRRVTLSRLMLSSAKLWILDEPFVALDMVGIALLVDIVVAHLSNGGLAIVTSHQKVEVGTVVPQVLEITA
jgi:heme exporter protein A